MKYRTYEDEEGDEVEFTVFLIHGHSDDWKVVKRFIRNELGFQVEVLADTYNGQVIWNKFRDAIWERADCAVAIMSPDDRLEQGTMRARQNVIYELGYCQGVFDARSDDEPEINPVIILKERTIDFHEVSDLLGVETLTYDKGSLDVTFKKLGRALESIYAELGGDEEWG